MNRTRSYLYHATLEHLRWTLPGLPIHALSQLARAAIERGLVRDETKVRVVRERAIAFTDGASNDR